MRGEQLRKRHKRNIEGEEKASERRANESERSVSRMKGRRKLIRGGQVRGREKRKTRCRGKR